VKLPGRQTLRLCKSFRVLAYVFWHTPGANDGIVTDEAALGAPWTRMACEPRNPLMSALADARPAAWFDKSAGASYDEFLGRRGGRGSLWQRQMVLGPTPEFCSLGDEDPPGGAVIVTRVRTVGASAS